MELPEEKTGAQAADAAAAGPEKKRIDRRAALSGLAVGAVAAIGGALLLDAARHPDMPKAAVSASIAAIEGDEGADRGDGGEGTGSALPASDFDTLAAAGLPANYITETDPASSFEADERFSGAAGSRQALARWDYDGLEPGQAYMLTAKAYAPEYREVEDRSQYPDGWRFAKEEGGKAFEIARLSPAAAVSAVVRPVAGTGSATLPIALPDGLDAADAVVRCSMTILDFC